MVHMNSLTAPAPPAFLALVFLSSVATAFVPRGGVGMLKMCPPGGEAFATAWQLTCGMRKKRSVQMEEEVATTTTSPHLDDVHDFALQGVLQEAPAYPDAHAAPETLRSRRSAKGTAGAVATSAARHKDQYRPLSMTEMMHFCCRFGCTFRDLLPYCDPFGTWDS